MWFALLLGCPGEGPPPTPKACKKHDAPPTCTLVGMIDGQRTEGEASLVAGVQGGMHVDVGVDLTEVGSVIRYTSSLVDEQGTEYAWDDAIDLVTDVADDCTASPYGVRAVFQSIPTACGLADVPVTIRVELERDDGATASCSMDVVLRGGDSSDWLCEGL